MGRLGCILVLLLHVLTTMPNTSPKKSVVGLARTTAKYDYCILFVIRHVALDHYYYCYHTETHNHARLYIHQPARPSQ